MIGNNAREGFRRVADADLLNTIHNYYGDAAPKALKIYGVAIDGSIEFEPDPVLGTAAAQWSTDTSLRCGAVITAAQHAANGNPVYSYQFEQSIPGRESNGAAHSFELPYVFGQFPDDGILGAPYTSKDRALSELMISYWTNFAKHGDPNGPGIPAWPRFTNDARSYLQFATVFDANAKANQGLRRDACQIFEEIIVAQRGDLEDNH